MNFGEKLKLLRDDLSQVAAAKRAKISQQQWSKLERGIVKPEDSAVIPDIARAWGMSTEELLAGVHGNPTGEKSPRYGDTTAYDNADSVIERARSYWESTIRERRPVAVMIAKMIIVMSGYQVSAGFTER